MRNFLTCLLLSSLACAFPARAGDDPLDAKLTFDAGWFFVSTDTRVRINGETTQLEGSDIDFDETFGVDDSDRFRLDAMWRIGQRHAVHALYFENNRSGTREMTRDVNFGDETFPIGASVTAKTELTVAELFYDYAFVRNDKFEFAGGGGLHVLDMNLSLDGTISGSGGMLNGSIAESASTAAPLPVFGARALWRMSEKFYLSALAQYFSLSFDNYRGSLSDLKAQVVWQVAPHVGVGLGYDDFRFRFRIDGERNFDGRLHFGYGGAMAFLNASF